MIEELAAETEPEAVRNMFVVLFDENRNLAENLSEDSYPDPQLVTLTIDVVFFIKTYLKQEEPGWWPSKEEYDPGISVEEWVSILNNPEIFPDASLALVARFKDFGGEATCRQISDKYGDTAQHYNMLTTRTCERIINNTSVNKPTFSDGSSNFFPVIFYGKAAESDEPFAMNQDLLCNLSLWQRSPRNLTAKK